MSRFDENIFGRIAVYHGFLRREQLQECMEEERSLRGRQDLGQILLRKGYLTKDQLEMIREIRRKKARKALRDLSEIEHSERSFGQIALRRGLVGVGQMEAALLEQGRLRRLNLQFRLGEVLVGLGFLRVEEVLEILNEQKKRILYCPSCDDHYGVFDYRAGGDYRCKQCGGPLEEPLFLDPVALDGMIGEPEPSGGKADSKTRRVDRPKG